MNMKMLNNRIKREAASRKLKMYIKHSYSRTVYGDDDGFFYNLVKNYNNIIPFENPDMYYEYEDDIVAIEHFEFDSYKKVGGKGSLGKRDVVITQKDMDSEWRNMGKDYVTRNIKAEMSIDNYIANLIDVFKRHYDNVPKYVNNIRCSFPYEKSIKMCFYIEDSTPLGNRLIAKDRNTPLHPLYIKEFVDILKESNNIDYVIYSLKDEYFTKLYFFQNGIINRGISVDYYNKNKHVFLNYSYELISQYSTYGNNE